MQNAKDIFADNVDALLGGADISIKPLVEEAKSSGEDIDYSYVTRVRNNKINPSLVKSEQIVRVLKRIDGFDFIELWMFLVPGYFRDKVNLTGVKSAVSSVDTVQFTKELLFALRTMRTIDISEKQYGEILNVAEYLNKKANAGLHEEFSTQQRRSTN